MKKLRILGITLMMFFAILGLVGCKKNEDDKINQNPEDITNEINTSSKDDDSEISEIISGAEIDEENLTSGEVVVSSGDSGENSSGDITDTIGLYSTENRAVFNFGNVYYVIFDFDGDKVSNSSYCYVFESEEMATLTYEDLMESLKSPETIEENELQDVKEIRREGKHVIIVMQESSYADLTKQEVMDTYSLLEQIYQN